MKYTHGINKMEPEELKDSIEKEYTPISCDYVDYIEHLATLNEVVSIKYLVGQLTKTANEDQLLTWKNEGGEEFLYTKNGLKIRFDQIVSINNKASKHSCKP